MIKIASPALILFAGLLAGQGTVDVAGTWNTVAKPHSPLMTTVYEPTFEFKVEGGNLTGVARVGGWPGDGTISDGKVEGNRITFTLTHERTYTMNAGTFHPTLQCVGTVNGNELDLTMVSVHPGFVNPELINRGEGAKIAGRVHSDQVHLGTKRRNGAPGGTGSGVGTANLPCSLLCDAACAFAGGVLLGFDFQAALAA